MLGLSGREITADNIREYQAACLGRSHGQTLLVELMPFPKPTLLQWGYETLIPQFPSREEYYYRVKPQRICYLKELLAKHKPKVVIGYGKAYWPEYKTLFDGVTFTPDGQFEIATSDSTLAILTYHFTSQTMNNKFDQVGSLIKSNRPR